MAALRKVGAVAGSIVCIALGGASPALAGDLEDGVRRASAGDCAGARGPLAAAVESGEAGPTAALLLSQCLIQLKAYDEARDRLEALSEAGAQGDDLELYLGIARYHTGDLEGAREALGRAAELSPERAEIPLYRGLLAIEAKEWERAVASLESARELGGERVEPMASYYLAVARTAQGERERARQDARRVMESAPDGAWVDEAGDLAARLQRADRPRWQAQASTGYEYDDNVVLRGEGVRLPDEISNQDDSRFVWRLSGALEALRGESWSAGLNAGYAGSRHHELGEFDAHFPTVTLWGSRRVTERDAARLEYQFGHAWVDGDPYLMIHAVNPTWTHAWSGSQVTRALGRFYSYGFEIEPIDVQDGTGSPGDPCPDLSMSCGPPGLDESRSRSRDGLGFGVGFDHAYTLGDGRGQLRGGFLFQDYLADGSESSYLSFEPKIGARIALPLGLYANTWLFYSYRPYTHPSSLPDPSTVMVGEQYALIGGKRRDHQVRTQLDLERAITELVSASFRYGFVDNRSNFDSFQYQRHIVGGHLTFRVSR